MPACRRIATAAIALCAVAVAGCNDASTPRTVDQPQPTQSGSTVAPPIPSPGVGLTVTTAAGFTYLVTASRVTSVTAVTSYQDAQFSAPPGEQFLQADLVITNSRADRPEPDIAFTDNGTGDFDVALPKADAGRLPDTSGCDDQVQVDACLVISSEYGTETPQPSSPISPQIPPKSSVHLTLFAGPIPDSIAASTGAVYYNEAGRSPQVIRSTG